MLTRFSKSYGQASIEYQRNTNSGHECYGVDEWSFGASENSYFCEEKCRTKRHDDAIE